MHDRLAAAESRRAALLQNMEALAQVLEDGEKGGERRQLERSLRGVSEALGALQAARPAHVSKRAVQPGGVSGIEAATKSVEVASVPSYAPVPPAVL